MEFSSNGFYSKTNLTKIQITNIITALLKWWNQISQESSDLKFDQ